jgi:predicted small metal-binding protein
MKTMTCSQLGGPCAFAHRGNTANEVIKAQDSHLKEMVASGDEAHKSALSEMQGRWKNPLSGMGWYRKTKREFAALPEDPVGADTSPPR